MGKRHQRHDQGSLKLSAPPVSASIDPVNDGQVLLSFCNRTGHVEGYVVTGTVPAATFSLNGNTRYSTSLSIVPGATIVEVRQGGAGGQVLASFSPGNIDMEQTL